MARIVRKLDIPGSLAQRQQAVADFLGYNKVVTSGSARYISRGTPLPYTFAVTAPSSLPAQQYLYAANITRGEALAPNGTVLRNLTGGPVGQAGGVGVGGNFTKYRYTTEFTTRPYDIKPDSAVLAVASSLAIDGNVNIGFFPPSPLYDEDDDIGFPDEGQMLAGIAFTTFPNWPPPNPPKFSTTSRYITRFFRPNTTMRVLPYGMMHFFSDNVPLREGTAFREGTASVRYQWHLVPEDGIPLQAIGECLTCVNDNWFDGFAPRTLAFTGMDMRRFIGPLGNALYMLEYLFNWVARPSRTGSFLTPPFPVGFPLGWNSQLRIKKVDGKYVLDYDQVCDDNTNAPPRNPHDEADFSALFRPDQP